MYDIDRKTASKILKVSIRTVDRYISAKKLSFEERDGRIWLDKKEVLKVRGQKRPAFGGDGDNGKMSIDKMGVFPVDMTVDAGDFVSTTHGAKRSANNASTSNHYTEEMVYQKLYEELRHESKEQQNRLEGANYRVGQLEAMIKDSIPLLEHQQMLLSEHSQVEEIRRNFEPVRLQNEDLQGKIQEEKLNKRIYLAILFILMLLQPLWLVLSLKK